MLRFDDCINVINEMDPWTHIDGGLGKIVKALWSKSSIIMLASIGDKGEPIGVPKTCL